MSDSTKATPIMTASIAGVGEVPAIWLSVPFSLSCIDCDAGMDVESLKSAALEGWKRIHFDDGGSWNFLGYCPDCGPVCCGREQWASESIVAWDNWDHEDEALAQSAAQRAGE